jgi:serine phosphatase RsbU (regulator of sigma subunit)
MRKLYFIIVLLFSISSISYAQNAEADSIRALINPKMKDKARLASLYHRMAAAYGASELDSMKKYTVLFEKLLPQTKMYDYLCSTYHNLSNAYRHSGDYKMAIEISLKELEVAKEHNLEYSYELDACNGLLLAYSEQGNHIPGIEYGYRGLHLAERNKDTLKNAVFNNNLADVFFYSENYPKAIEHYRKALYFAVLLDNKYGQGLITTNIGSVYYQQEKLDSAKIYFIKAINLTLEVDDKEGYAINLENLGSFYHKINQLDSALLTYNKAEKIFKELNLRPNLAGVYFNYSEVYFDKKNYVQATLYGEKSLKIAKEIDGLSQKRNANKVLYMVYEKLNNPAKALEHYKQYYTLRDSIDNEEKQKKQYKLGLDYEYRKRKYSDSLDKILTNKLQKESIQKEQLKTQTQKKITYLSLAGCMVFVVLSIFIYRNYREKKVAHQIISKQKLEVEFQKQIVEEHQKEILDSIHYAKRIQNTLLAHHDFLNENIPNNFVYFNPKDIVSGDFYWATKHDDNFYLAVCDSTGHGVPGAFMSLLNIGFLSEAINEKNITETNLIFEYVRERLISSVSKEGQKDGFDGIILRFNNKTNEISFTAANNAPILISNNELVELTKDKMPVGLGEKKEQFTCHKIDVKKGDMLYLYTDGYADQFGGPNGKKFKYKPLNDLLLSISNNSLEKQKQKLEKNFNNWKGELEQVDDVCVIGIKL